MMKEVAAYEQEIVDNTDKLNKVRVPRVEAAVIEVQ
jgi:hypothetical protein